MTYNLSEATFENDFYSLDIADGSTVIFNLVNEEITYNTKETVINAVNIAVIDSDGNYIDGVNVIGESNAFYTLASEYKEYVGRPLDKDNLKYCTLEVSDD